MNCNNATAKICGGYSRRDGNYADLVYNAQWWGPSFIPLANGDTQVLFLGRRWLSGPNLPEGCFDICGNGPPLGRGNKAACQAGGDKYEMRSDHSVWYPVQFAADGSILPFKATPSYTLDLPDQAGGGSLCHAQMVKLCGASRNTSVGNCMVCMGTHQGEMRASNCAPRDFKAFCQE